MTVLFPKGKVFSTREEIHVTVFLFSYGLLNQNWSFKNTPQHETLLKSQKPISLEGKRISTFDGINLIFFNFIVFVNENRGFNFELVICLLFGRLPFIARMAVLVYGLSLKFSL